MELAVEARPTFSSETATLEEKKFFIKCNP
jgi:hypothetical protein